LATRWMPAEIANIRRGRSIIFSNRKIERSPKHDGALSDAADEPDLAPAPGAENSRREAVLSIISAVGSCCAPSSNARELL